MKIFLILIALSFLVYPISANAQNVSPGDQPGAQASRFRARAEEEKKLQEKKKPAPSRVEVEKKEEAAPAAPSPSFALKSVNVTGSTVFRQKDFKPAYQAFIGQQVTFKDLEAIAAAVKAIYDKKGYLASDAYVPEQDIAGGTLEIRVSEGKLGELKVEGNKWFSADLIKKFIHIKKNGLLNILVLEKDMLRLNQNPDLNLTAVMKPGKVPGTADIVLKAVDNMPYHAGISIDNQGTRLVGKTRVTTSVRSTNFSGNNDSISIASLKSKTSSGDFLSYTIPVGTLGTRAGIDYTFFNLKQGKEFLDLDITGTTQILTPHLTQELFLSENFQAYADYGLDMKSVRKRDRDNVVINDQLRIPYVSYDLSKTDTFAGGGQTTFAPKFSFGTAHFLDASARGHDLASRPDTGGFYFKYEQALQRVQRAFWGTYVLVKTQFQAASHTLPSSEQLQLGGASSVRGYPEGEYLADTGVVMNVEWVFPCPLIPKEYSLPHAKIPLRNQIQPVIFLDLGTGRIKEPASGENPDRFLMGAGCGLRIQLNDTFSVHFDWAERLGERPTPGQGPSNVYISCQIEV